MHGRWFYRHATEQQALHVFVFFLFFFLFSSIRDDCRSKTQSLDSIPFGVSLDECWGVSVCVDTGKFMFRGVILFVSFEQINLVDYGVDQTRLWNELRKLNFGDTVRSFVCKNAPTLQLCDASACSFKWRWKQHTCSCTLHTSVSIAAKIINYSSEWIRAALSFFNKPLLIFMRSIHWKWNRNHSGYSIMNV